MCRHIPRFAASLLFLLLVIEGSAQSQRLGWRKSGPVAFVFEISNKEAQRLLTRGQSDSVMYRMLHTQVDTFNVRRGWTRRPDRGHFIVAQIIENELYCSYDGILPYQVFLLKEHDALALQVIDRDGNVRDDARVRFKHRVIATDRQTHTFRVANNDFWTGRQFVSVELDGFRSFFEVEKQERPHWSPSAYNPSAPDFYSYMITDKNRYRPGEKVRFKSYALSYLRNPIQKSLEVWLSGNNAVKVGTITPHRPGSFAGELVLHDSLKLALDKSYSLSLRDPRGRHVAQCSFKFEDYELNGDHLAVELASEQQYFPVPNVLTIRATDSNGLPVAGAKVSVAVRPHAIQETFQPVLYVPDTLLYVERELSMESDTKLEIPAGIFDQSSMTYTVDVTMLSNSGQQLEQSKSATFHYQQYAVESRLSADSILYEVQHNGVTMRGLSAELQYDDNAEYRIVTLPYEEKINTSLKSVTVKTVHASRTIDLKSMLPSLEIIGGLERDSFNVTIINPHKLPVSWLIYRGTELIDKGFGSELSHHSIIADRSMSYYVDLSYAYGGELRVKHREFRFNDKLLALSLQLPDRVYPGQTVDALIKVTTQAGYPVSGVDLTAFAVTSKLDYSPRPLSDYGTLSPQRETGENYDERPINKRSAVFRLDYNRWAKRAGLDTMKYYQLLYPGRTGFIHRRPIQDSTQFSIYVMNRGAEQKGYVVEVNRHPVYYSWTTTPSRYSFYVDPAKKNEITVRLWDRVIVFDSWHFARNQKTIVSVDLNHLPEGVHEVMLYQSSRRHRLRYAYPTLTQTEQTRYLKYLAQFDHLSGPAYLISQRQFTPLSKSSQANRVIAGPIVPGAQTVVSNGHALTYRFEGGGRYFFENNVVYREPSRDLLPGELLHQESRPSVTLEDLALTKEEFLRRDVENVAPWITTRIDATDYLTGLTILLPEDEQRTGVYGVLFQDPITGIVTSACSNRTATNMALLPRGRLHLIVLYNDGRYLKMENVVFRKRQQIWIDFRGTTLRLPDPSTSSWRQQASGNCFPQSIPRISSLRQPRRTRSGYAGNASGTVYDEAGMPMPGVNIVIKGTTFGTVTDIEGNFSLELITGNEAIVVSFIGYKTAEVGVQPGSIVAVQMEADVTALQEVVVAGYGLEIRGALTYSMSSLLQGRVAGVQVQVNETSLSETDQQEQRQGEEQLYTELLTINGMRSNFTDVGFWEPKLYTNRKGIATFTVTFPDDITQWNAVVYAMNRRLQTGMTRKSIRSYKPIMAQLDVPRFLVQGDSANGHGNLSNFTTDTSIEGTVIWRTPGVFIDTTVRFDHHLYNSLPLTATGKDSVKTSFEFNRSDGYRDGELRGIPVIEKGTLRAEGGLSIFANGDRQHIAAESGEQVTVELLGSTLDIFATEAANLIDYQYACNEQLASKLLGLIAYRNVTRYEEKVFHYDADVRKIIQRLLKNQNSEFLWSWWDVSPHTSYWISAHILRALKVAQDAGYKVDLNVKGIASKATYKFDLLESFSYHDADLLQALAEWKAPVNYRAYVTRTDSLLLQHERYLSLVTHRPNTVLLRERLLLMEIRQLIGMPFQRDSLLRYRREAIRGEVYFSNQTETFDWYRDELAANAVAYRIIRRDTALHHLLLPMQLYFVSRRTSGQWNTYQGANLLLSVMPDLLSMGASREHPYAIVADGKFNGTIEKLPFKITLQPHEQLNLSKERGLPAYLMQYSMRRVTEAVQGSGGFRIATTLGNGGQVLTAGKAVKMIVDVTVTKSAKAEYVMIEIPIPAACSYTEDRKKSYLNETHREYFKDRVNIYFEHLGTGDYRFEIELLPRFTGRFHVNPAQISLMYVPVINANTALRVVRVVN